MVIGKDVLLKVLDDAGKTIQEHIRTEMNDYKCETERRKLELIDLITTTVKDIEDQGNISKTVLFETLKSSIEAIEIKVKESINKIQERGKQIIDEGVKKLNEGVQKLNKEKENAIKEIQEAKKGKVLFVCFFCQIFSRKQIINIGV